MVSIDQIALATVTFKQETQTDGGTTLIPVFQEWHRPKAGEKESTEANALQIYTSDGFVSNVCCCKCALFDRSPVQLHQICQVDTKLLHNTMMFCWSVCRGVNVDSLYV